MGVIVSFLEQVREVTQEGRGTSWSEAAQLRSLELRFHPGCRRPEPWRVPLRALLSRPQANRATAHSRCLRKRTFTLFMGQTVTTFPSAAHDVSVKGGASSQTQQSPALHPGSWINMRVSSEQRPLHPGPPAKQGLQRSLLPQPRASSESPRPHTETGGSRPPASGWHPYSSRKGLTLRVGAQLAC